MEWVTTIKEAIRYIDDELLTVQSPDEVANHVHISQMYLQQGFQIITGFTIGEYIRNRRLYLAALDLLHTKEKVIDIALKYGYETPESFNKAFTRFHNASPTAVRKGKADVKSFLSLKISIVIRGGNSMDYTVENQESFKVIGFSREFSFENSKSEIPDFWTEVFTKYFGDVSSGAKPANETQQAIVDNNIGEFGVCIDDIGKEGKFRYMVGGKYNGGKVPDGLEVYDVPATEFAKFKCVEATLQKVNSRIWNEWLPGNNEYEIDGTFNLEWYSRGYKKDISEYPCEIWIPISRK